MGKKQHQKDKLYLTTTEWKNQFGGYKGKQVKNQDFRRLPFSCCTLSMQPFENPLCTKDGVIYDLMSIVPFLKKYGINPVTGDKLSAKELVRLNFHKNADGKYHCPVTFKVFNENTHIVAVRQTGNVFANEAVERLNVKTNFWRDLLTDEPFTRKDLITIQDPTNLDKFNIQKFYHVQKGLKVTEDDEDVSSKDPKNRLKTINAETRDVLATLEKEYKAPEKRTETKKVADKFNSAHYSTGAVSASFTSTAMEPTTQHEAAIIDEDIIRYERLKKKGYVRLLTNRGPLNLELHCDMVPKTCENFIKLTKRGYYDNTVFHRIIRNFMIQGGDPEGTGKGGESAWGGTFKDEFKPNLTHSGRGVLSMANSGPDTNKSQFFITFRSARHLDGKHTVFGRVVGGLETLDAMEKIEADKKDRPQKEIRIEATAVFVNPYEEVDEELANEREDELSRQAAAEAEKRKPKSRKEEPKIEHKVFSAGVGKYINPSTLKRKMAETEATVSSSEGTKKKVKTKTSLSDFSAW
ncbi:RING-type E3 ubiquitin-protein ligase PPIL2-like [Mya arenaria]|uniref:RING-type E3 ubiquitin-protein ligase PPIL2-like n=1 Tax=Mya arenaria TaxID=6604 RepID=UPI0022E3B829|nr:RING-type E3 ubiquitin-protein ligase PPIL2-like [Mya arenaria]XP_052800520.1 RING-type E3 ubiquitin-protein ligase PPIL2-like [Mya arenaria]